nr:MAG TPA: hypothetical protein [Caudoviricetes sp.]
MPLIRGYKQINKQSKKNPNRYGRFLRAWLNRIKRN